LHWIQNTLADGEGRTLFGKDDIRENLLPDVNGCQVTFVYSRARSDWEVTDHTRQQVNLGDLDPASLTVTDGLEDKDILGDSVRDVTVHTTDKVRTIRLTPNDWGWQPLTLQSTDLLWQLPAPYAARFANALKHAITLCGGKPSSF
jgi:hypothetical protein